MLFDLDSISALLVCRKYTQFHCPRQELEQRLDSDWLESRIGKRAGTSLAKFPPLRFFARIIYGVGR
jgi:hypothetical protein